MIQEVVSVAETIPGVLIDSSTPDYRIAHGVLGEAKREHAVVVREQVSQEMFLSAITAKWGNLSSIAKELELPRHYVEQRIKADIDLWQAYVNAEEMKTDLLEDSLFDKGLAGDTRAATTWLEAKAKHRGWGKETRTLNVGINVKDLSVEELQQVVKGEIPERMK